MSIIEIERRKPIWIALSEFYLDVELQPEDFVRIRAIFDQSGYSQEEIRQIDYDEVSPTLLYNVLSMAGEWMGFDERILTELIVRRAGRRLKFRTMVPFNWVWRLIVDFFNKSYFKSIFPADHYPNKPTPYSL